MKVNYFTILYWFCHTSTWIHYRCSPFWTLLPPPSPYHPSGLSQCTSPKHPVSCIEPGLATRFLRVPWTARRSNQSILKEINPEYSLEGLTPKLKYFGYPMWRSDSLEKTLMLGKHNEDWRHKEKEMTEDKMIGWYHPLNGHKFEQAPGVGDGHGSLVCWQSMGSQRAGHDWVTKLK